MRSWKPRQGEIVVQGRVTSVTDGQFTVDEGLRTVRVDVDTMPYNPLDDRGHQSIAAGDLVMVSGKVSATWFSDEHLDATAVLKLGG